MLGFRRRTGHEGQQPGQTDGETSSEATNNRQTGLFRLDADNTVLNPTLPTYHLDIIGIHGLNGNAFTTWTNKHREMWLGQFLPASLPGARVYTFGYNSTIFSQSKADISDYARSLLSELDLERQSEADKQRGIVFICHSMGGIVCKKALVIAHEVSRYTNILQSTKAVVFFGTPHFGSKQADSLSVLANAVAIFGSISMVDRTYGKIRQDLMRVLKTSSEELHALSTSFKERGKELNVVSFYEEYAMPPFKRELVSRSSARTYLDNEELIPLAANHEDMCKLSTDMLAYKKIVQICQAHGRVERVDPTVLNFQEQECLKTLNVIDMNDLRAHLHPHTLGTCKWILSKRQLCDWISDRNPALLHITGHMGTGKSILMSYLVDALKPLFDAATSGLSQKATICSFFCDDKDAGRKQGQAILRGLLYQILHQRHDLMKHATARLSEGAPGRWSLTTLWEILEDIMLDPITGTVVIILDAVDECEPISRDRILTLIRQFFTKRKEPESSCIKLLISSRPSVDLLEEIGQYSSVLSLDNEAMRNIDDDIHLVVKDQLDKLAINIHWPFERREALERMIVMKAERNFLWVTLVIKRLKKGQQNKTYFEKVVNESPRDLDGLYCRILSDIDTENLAFATKALRILVGSYRPITLAELQLVLAISSDHRTLEAVEDESDMAIERTTRLVLGSLIRIYDQKVLLVHQSAKEFLLRLSAGEVAGSGSVGPDLQNSYGVSPRTANLELATACIAFLGLADFDKKRDQEENMLAFNELPGSTGEKPWLLLQQASGSLLEHPGASPRVISTISTDPKASFFEYSASYWAFHLRESGECIPQRVLKSAIRLSYHNTNCLTNWSDRYRLSSMEAVTLPKELSPLIVAAFFGLIHLANSILSDNASQLQDQDISSALSWACRMGHVDVANMILGRGIPVSDKRVEGGSPLSWASAGGHLEIVKKLLLDKAGSLQVNTRDASGRTPLSLAVGSGHLSLVKFFLAREDVDVNMGDRIGSPPLLWAIGSRSTNQDLELLKCLVSDPRVDIVKRDRYGRTVLSWAAEMGSLDAVDILIRTPRSDIQSLLDDPGDSDRWWSPLSWAAFNGHLEVVQALCLTRKIDVQLASVDRRGQNAVSLAADKNYAEIIKILAKFYPQGVDCPDESGRTPLSCSMWGSSNNAETVRALLQTGLVDANRRAFNGRTPLFYAAAAGRADLVSILVEEGMADVDIRDNEGKAPDDVCRSAIREEIGRLRRRHYPGR